MTRGIFHTRFVALFKLLIKSCRLSKIGKFETFDLVISSMTPDITYDITLWLSR